MSTKSNAPAFLALSCVGMLSSPALAADAPVTAGAAAAAIAADDPQDDGETKPIIVTGTNPTSELESPKYVRPLLDTPQTITVISNTTLRKQNLLSLREALTTIPGITFGAGEGGGGYGDSINLRGQSANTDLQIDGVRDSAQYSRSDTFNLEQIEVVNGANSVYGGSGSIGGTINLVTKRPQADDLTVIQAGVGTDNYYRGTVDSNLRVSDMIAIRLNAMYHKNDVPGRDFDNFERWGIAPALTLGIDGPTKLTFLYVHQEDDNTPVYGVPYYSALGGLLPGADYSGYYGYKDVDQQKQTVDQATIIFDHEFNENLSIRNLARWQRVEQNLIVNPPQGAFCLANGQLPTGAACAAGQLPGIYYPSGPRGTARFSENQMMYDQLDLRANFETGGIGHTLTLGASFAQEDYDLSNGNVLRNPGGALPNPTLPPINISNPDPIYGGPINYVRGGGQVGDTRNISVYLFDAIKFSDQFEINGGVRWENNRAVFHTDTYNTTPGATFGAYTRGVEQISDDNLFSYRIGAVFKPTPNSSLYAAYGNSRTPASASVRAGCGLPTAQTLGIDPCNVKPQEAVNYEIGGKIDLANGALQLTAALFRNERTNYPVTANDPSVGILQVLDGRSRVDGVALGATGNITPEWSIFANYTYLKSKVLQSVSNYCLANPGTTFTPPGGTAITCPTADLQRGNPLTNTPKHSGSLFTTYTFPFGLQIGYGLTYQGEFLLNNNTGSITRSKDWLTHRAFVSYPITEGLTAQVNVQNLTDKKYFTGIRNNGWATPGEGRSAVLSIFYSF